MNTDMKLDLHLTALKLFACLDPIIPDATDIAFRGNRRWAAKPFVVIAWAPTIPKSFMPLKNKCSRHIFSFTRLSKNFQCVCRILSKLHAKLYNMSGKGFQFPLGSFLCWMVKDMRTSANYVDCATRITVCRSVSLIKRLTLIIVKKLTNLLYIYNANMLTLRHGRIRFSICTVALHCLQ